LTFHEGFLFRVKPFGQREPLSCPRAKWAYKIEAEVPSHCYRPYKDEKETKKVKSHDSPDKSDLVIDSSYIPHFIIFKVP
jgi:uncharacterized protein YbaR (Trm112 family)